MSDIPGVTCRNHLPIKKVELQETSFEISEKITPEAVYVNIDLGRD